MERCRCCQQSDYDTAALSLFHHLVNPVTLLPRLSVSNRIDFSLSAAPSTKTERLLPRESPRSKPTVGQHRRFESSLLYHPLPTKCLRFGTRLARTTVHRLPLAYLHQYRSTIANHCLLTTRPKIMDGIPSH